MPVYFPQIRNGITSQKGYSTTVSFLHSISEMEAGPRYSYAWRLNPLGAFQITHSSIGTDDVAVLEAFFNSMCGRFGTFCYLDPGGNLFPNSEGYVDGSLDPFGGHRAGFASTACSQLVLPAGGAQGMTITTSIWVYGTAPGQTMNIGLSNAWGTVSLSTNVWKRVWFTAIVPDNSPVTAFIYSPATLRMYGAQCSPLPGPGSYSKTPEMLGYHSSCRFDQDDFKVKYGSIDECAVSLRIAEFNQ